jgi:hypothetical protein
VVIDMTAIDDRDPGAWVDLVGADLVDGQVMLYKAVDDALMAGHNHIPTTYPVGSTVEATDWRDDHSCGGGLHVSPTPRQATDCAVSEATRMLVVTAPLETVRSIGRDKCKVPRLTVVREVTLDGDPIPGAAT